VTRIERLPLDRPSAIAGGRQGIWVADAAAKSVCLFDAASAALHASVPLDDEPQSVAIGADLLAVALASGEVLAIGAADRTVRWRRRGASRDIELAGSRDRVWAWDRGAAKFLAWDQSGSEEQFEGEGTVAFAAADAGVYSLASDGNVRYQSRARASSSARLPHGAAPTGPILFCANSLWIAVSNGLLLAARDSLAARATLRIPEPAATHLLCYNGRIFGGGRTAVFAIEPAADDNARSLGITPRSALVGLAASGRHVWALESAKPDVHVVQIP
jgi:hypothetical protein